MIFHKINIETLYSIKNYTLKQARNMIRKIIFVSFSEKSKMIFEFTFWVSVFTWKSIWHLWLCQFFTAI